MKHFDRQTDFWDRAAAEKNFTHPLDAHRVTSLLGFRDRILDYGCGYGRTCSVLHGMGFTDVVGVDISERMIRRGRRCFPDLRLQTLQGGSLPFRDESFDAVLLFAVLTCIPGDEGQRSVVSDIFRVLKPGGLLYASDYPLQSDDRNLVRYRRFEKAYGCYGVFEIDGGGVVRHHRPAWFESLFSAFEPVAKTEFDVATMNGHPARIFQYFGRRPLGPGPGPTGP